MDTFLSNFRRKIHTKRLRAGEGILWIVGELVGVAIFGGMALLGLRGSLWWIVAGWAFHPL